MAGGKEREKVAMREPNRNIVDRIRRSIRARLTEQSQARINACAVMRERYHAFALPVSASDASSPKPSPA